MDTYFLLSAVFFVLLILFQALQSVGKKMNKIANTYGVRKSHSPSSRASLRLKLQKKKARNLRMTTLLLKDASDKLNTRKLLLRALKN